MHILLIGLLIFFTAHSITIVFPGWRSRMLKVVGIWAWQSLFAVISMIGFIMIVYGYDQTRTIPTVLYTSPEWMHYVTAVLMIPVFPLLLATYLPGRIQATAKHPMLAAIKLWAVAHLLVNGSLADVLLFGSFLVWAVADRISLKHRSRAVASIAVNRKLNDILVLVLGIGIYAAFLAGVHKWLIGVPILK